MNAIAEEAVVSCYVAAAAFLVMVVLLCMTARISRMKDASIRIIYWESLCVTAECVLVFVGNAMYMQTAPWCHTVALVARTVRECLVLVIIDLWLLYVRYRLYGKTRVRYRFLMVNLPFVIIFILLIVNVFTGFLFTYTATNRIAAKLPLLIIFLVEFLFFSSSAVLVRFYDSRATKTRFLRISPMILSVLLASGTQFISRYDVGVLGYVLGITLLYFSMIEELRFVDQESGLYNRRYVSYLMDMAIAGKNDTRSALILEADGDIPSGFQILQEVLHKEGDVIRVENRKFLMFTREDRRSVIEYLSSLVNDAVEKHNREHPDKKVQISAHLRTRGEGEDEFDFLRTAMDEKEGGYEMRGIVSMISELERLDQELTLAANIQTSVLPLKFPPFPDRREFDLYASMTPAKEVGGDFYDFFLIDSDHLALVIADVSGKGIPAALFMMTSKTLIKNQLMSGFDPAATLEHVNLQLCEHNTSMMFVTVWLAVLEISTGHGVAVNAGHENPGLRRAGSGFELLKYKHDILIGISKKAQYHNREFDMGPGDCLFVYTDGVPEATNGTQKMFDAERLADTLNEDPDADPETLIKRVHAAVDTFAEGTPQFDDITMLCLKYYGAQKQEETA